MPGQIVALPLVMFNVTELASVPVGTSAPDGQPFAPATGAPTCGGTGTMFRGAVMSLSGSLICGMWTHTFDGTHAG